MLPSTRTTKLVAKTKTLMQYEHDMVEALLTKGHPDPARKVELLKLTRRRAPAMWCCLLEETRRLRRRRGCRLVLESKPFRSEK